MAHSVNVRISGQLRDYVDQQTGPDGLYESASEYVRELIRRDRQTQQEAGWNWLRAHLQPLADSPDDVFIQAGPDAVIQRARARLLGKGK
jgi:putative addiction module CopG family antidote